MQSRQLHASLHAFALAAGAMLAAAVAGGDEIGFEVVEEGARGSRPGLYCYQALTAEFIERHWTALLALPQRREAQLALAALEGLEGYLDTYGQEHRAGASIEQDALRCFTRRAFEGAGEDFELAPERFEPAYRELAAGAGVTPGELAVVALLRGIECESPEVTLAEGVVLAPLGRLDVLPPDPGWRHHDGPRTVVALVPSTGPGAIAEALERLGDLQTALRLYGPGISLAPLAWLRAQRASWRPLPIPGGGRADGHVTVAAQQEDELRAFANLITRRRPAQGELAWALERFELAVAHDDPLVGLTDCLLALRALLEPEGPRSGRLAGRIAALCAQPHERGAATERVAHAISLERSLIAGVSVGGHAVELAQEIEDHLRALLRDVICGHLGADLVAVADSLVAADDEAPTGRSVARRLPRRPSSWEPASEPAAPTGEQSPLTSEEEDYWAAEGEIPFGERAR
jgi:tetratricopeptide (TPR) repeat protein